MKVSFMSCIVLMDIFMLNEDVSNCFKNHISSIIKFMHKAVNVKSM